MDKIICTINLGIDFHDEIYTFYTDGRIKIYTDRYPDKPNIEEILKSNQIPEYKKEKIIKSCPNEHIEIIKKILTIEH